MMQTHMLAEGQQSHIVFTHPPSSTAPNNPDYHGGRNGGWDHRSPALFAYQTPPVPPANGHQHMGQQAFQSRHAASRNYWKILPNVCPFPVSSSSCPSQGNTNLTVGPGHQLPLRNQVLAMVNYASPPANIRNTQCPVRQTSMRPDVHAARENLQNTQVFVQAHNYNISQEAMRSYRPYNAPQLPTSPEHRNCGVNQSNSQRVLIRSTGAQFSNSAVQEAAMYSPAQFSDSAVQEAAMYSPAQFSSPGVQETAMYSPAQFSSPGVQEAGLYSSAQFSNPAVQDAVTYSPAQFSNPAVQDAVTYSPAQFSSPAVQDAVTYSPAQFSNPAVQGAVTYSPAQFSRPAVQDVDPHRFQGSVNADQGVWNNGHEAVRTGRRESLNLPSAVKAATMGQKCSTRQEVRYLEQEMGCVRDVTKNWETELRLNPNFEVQCPPKVLDYVQGTVRGGQEVTTSTPNSAVPTAAPAQNASPHQQPRQAMDYVATWSNPLINSENKIDGLLRSLLITPETSSNATMHLAQAQCGGSAPSGILPHSSLNPSSSPGNGSSKRAMNKCGAATAQKSYQCVPSRAAAVHPPQNHAFPTQQGELLSTSQQPLPYPTAQGPVGQNTQGAANQTYRRGLAMPPPYVSPETKSGGTGEAVKHVMANHAPNRPSASGSDIGSYPEPSVGTSAFPSQAVQQGKQPCRDQTAGNLIIGSESQELSVTPRPVNTLTAGNESCTGNQPAGQAEAQQKSSQTSFADDSVKAECRKAHGGTSGTESLQNGSTHLSNAAHPSSEPLFKPPKVSSQPNKSPGSSSSQKAVAVVPPLSPQAWDPAEETSSISHMEGDLPCKILSVISLNAESAAGLFDIKMTDTAFESLLVSKTTGEKNIELAVPHQQKTSQTSGSTCQVIPPAPGDSATEKIDPQTSNQQKSDSTSPANLASPPDTEDTPPSGIHSHVPGGQAGVAVHENRDQDGDLEKAVFDLSSVAVTEWTTTRLVKLISLFHQIVGTPKQEMDVKKTAKLYGLEGYHDLLDVFSSDLYQSIMAEARSVCRESENSVVFSQIKPKSLEAVAKNCHILKHQPVLPSEEECELVKPSQAEKGKIVKTENVVYTSNRNTPLSMPKPQTDAPVGGTVDALSFIKIRVLPPEEARRIFAGEESKVVKLEDPQSELPAQEGQGDETSQMEVELSQRRQEEQQDKEKQVDVSCCPFHWMKVTTSCKNSFCTFKLGQGGEEESKIDPSGTQMEKGERVELIESSVGGDCSPAAENNTISVHEPETTKEYQPKEDLPKEDLPKEDLLKEDLPKEDQHIETKAPHLSECAQSRPADDSTQEEGNSTEGEAMVSSGEPEEGRGAPGPFECSSSEILFDPDIILHEVIIPAPNVSEVESENVYKDCEETLKMATAMSEQLWKERIAEAEHPILLQTNVDEVPTSGSEAEVDMALGSTRVGSQGEVPNQLPVSMDIRDLERRIGRQTSLSLRQRLHKRLSSTEKHDHEDEDDRRGEKRRCLEKSLCSTSPVREPSPQSAKDRERKEAVTVLKGTEDSHHNREKPLLAKRKGDHSASPESKRPKLQKDNHLSQGSNSEKRPVVSKGNSSKELAEQKAEGSSLYLKLYGSSSKAGNGAVSSSRQSVFKSHGGKIRSAPSTLGLSVHSKDSNHSEVSINSPAKQQVFSIWERSFVPLSRNKRSKTGTTKQCRIKGYGSQGGARTPAANPITFGNDSKSSRDQCRPKSSSQSTATAVKLREVSTHLGKSEENRNSTPKTHRNHLGKSQEKKSSAPKAGDKQLGKSQEKKSSAPKAGDKQLGKSQEKKSSAPKAGDKQLDKSQEKKSSVRKAGDKQLGKSWEKKSPSPKAGNKQLGKSQEKKSSVPKAGNKQLDKTQEKKSSAAKSTEKKFVSHVFVRQTHDLPTVGKTSRERRQQDLEKAPVSSWKTQAIPDKNSRPENKKLKKVEAVHFLRSPLSAPSPKKTTKNQNKTKNTAEAGRSDQIAVKEKGSVALPRSFHLKDGPDCMNSLRHVKTSCAKSQKGKDTFCSKGKSHGMVSAPFPPHVTFQDYKRRHMAKHKI